MKQTKKKCETCKIEYEGREDSRTCSPACKKKLQRLKGTIKGDIVEAKGDIKETDSLKGTNAVTMYFVAERGTDLVSEADPLKRITRPPEGKVGPEYYESETYKNLIEELEVKSIEQLKKEKYWIPAWKYAGHKKKPNMDELLKGLK
jgi:hypothetical protein